ncbi:MAG TPA: ATP-binding protein [Acidimicrobiales bacterium]|nr:ATP-binding protein [Acidimicrobiales bacterium]
MTSHLFGRLAVVESRVRAAVAARRAVDPTPDDPFRGLYLADEHVDRLLAPGAPAAAPPPEPSAVAMLSTVEQAADAAEARGDVVPLRRLAAAFDLAPLDVELLLVALAPDLDSRFERLYGYLNDDVSRRRASVGLALELCGLPLATAFARERLSAAGPLVRGGLVVVEDPDRPFPTRAVRVPDRVAAHLLGHDAPDPLVADLVVEPPKVVLEEAGALARGLHAGARVAYLRESRPGGAGRAVAVAALDAAFVVDLDRIDVDDVAAVARVAGREARLLGAGLVAGPIDRLDPAGVRAFAELPGPVVLTGRATWDPSWSKVVPLLLEAPVVGAGARATLWREALNGDGPVPDAVDVEAELAPFRMTPEHVGRAAVAARWEAAAAGSAIGAAEVRRGARSQNAAGLERLARRIAPGVGWDDLVLPPQTRAHLHEVAARARRRDVVLNEWGMRPGGGRGRGVTALFAGDSGTGKTMSAEVIAGSLGLDLYAVNLATVVDKYVGETEKNLERIFSEADGVNGILLFDEADALFGKRSEVSDAHDRYANIEVAYLLQRMESFDGLAILSTNLRSNIDEAFARRLDAIVDFPVPDAGLRRELWDRCLGAQVPRGDDIDLDFCAEAFELSGGNIRSVALTAAYLAAETGRPVTMADLIRATHREYRKLGRLSVAAEFGPWFDVVSTG